MTKVDTRSGFTTRLLRPRGSEGEWAFVVLPGEVSAELPRRGRTSVVGTLNGVEFTAVAEPDGRKGHWVRIGEELLRACGARVGEEARFEVGAVEVEPEPVVPEDLARALEGDGEARETWRATTTLARVDWIHWIESAKQDKTRVKRIADALDMLGSGKKRVCCFDPSGFYSKGLSAPQAEE